MRESAITIFILLIFVVLAALPNKIPGIDAKIGIFQMEWRYYFMTAALLILLIRA